MDFNVPRIRCFLSSRMPPRMATFRDAALEAVDGLGSLVELWRFEDRTPTSSDPATFFLEAVEMCDVLIAIVADDMSQPTMHEVRHAIDRRKDVLAIRLVGLATTPEAEGLIAALRTYGVTTADVEANPIVVRDRISRSLQSYIVERFRRAPSEQWRNAHLAHLEKAAFSRLERGFRATQLPEHLARELANDPGVGLDDELREAYRVANLLVVVGPLGSGKSTSLNRLFIEAVNDARRSMLAPSPLWLSARETRNGLIPAIENGYPDVVSGYFAGRAIFVDDVDGEDAIAIVALLRDARTLADSMPGTKVVISKRTQEHTEGAHTYELPELTTAQTDALLERIFPAEKHWLDLHFADYPASIQKSIRRPLFLILTALETERNFHSRRPAPSSEAQLLESLVVNALGPALPEISADTELQELAETLLDSGEETIMLRQLSNPARRVALLRSSLVASDGDRIGFALPVIEEWFAAHRLTTMSLDRVLEKVKDLKQSDRWYYALKLYVQMCPPDKAFDFTCRLAAIHPTVAMIIAREAWGHPDDAPDFQRVGERMRIAMRSLRTTFPALVPVRDDGEVASVLSAPALRLISRHRIRYGWFHDSKECHHSDVVTDLSEANQRSSRRCLGVITETDAYDDALFPFRLSAASLTESLKWRLENRALFVDHVALERESRWLDLLAVSGRGATSGNDRPIQFAEINQRIEHLPPGPVTFAERHPHRTVDLDVLRAYVAMRLSEGFDAEHYPSVAADQRPEGSCASWEPFSDEKTVDRAMYVYTAALSAYAKIVDTWLPGLRQVLTRRILLPAKVTLRLSRADDGWPLAADYMVPLEANSESSVDAAWGTVEDKAALNEMHTSVERFRDSSNPRIRQAVWEGVVEIFGPAPVHDTVYEWLSLDLKGFLEILDY